MWRRATVGRLSKTASHFFSTCNEDFSHISADDGPAWLTLLVVGHAIVPLMLVFGRNDYVPLWLAILILSFVTLIGGYLVFTRTKGIFIALIWLTGATGQNEFSDSSDLHDLVIPKRPLVSVT